MSAPNALVPTLLLSFAAEPVKRFDALTNGLAVGVVRAWRSAMIFIFANLLLLVAAGLSAVLVTRAALRARA